MVYYNVLNMVKTLRAALLEGRKGVYFARAECPPLRVLRHLPWWICVEQADLYAGEEGWWLFSRRSAGNTEVQGERLWLHVCNWNPSLATDWSQWLAIEGELCWSRGGQQERVYYRPDNGIFCAVVMEGAPKIIFDYDCGSKLDALGRRYYEWAFRGRDRYEAWMAPADAELVCFLTDSEVLLADLRARGYVAYYQNPYQLLPSEGAPPDAIAPVRQHCRWMDQAKAHGAEGW